MSFCPRCAAGLLPHTSICTTCCAPLTDSDPQPVAATAAVIASAKPPATPVEESALSNWPFGGADAEATAQVAAQVAAMAAAQTLEEELTGWWTGQSKTHVLDAVPSQRRAQREEAYAHSVPSVGPNPFLAAARIPGAADDPTAIEGYPV